jgi:hypothetical protein
MQLQEQQQQHKASSFGWGLFVLFLRIVPRLTLDTERRRCSANLFETVSFLSLPFAENLLHLCLVAANGDLRISAVEHASSASADSDATILERRAYQE